MRSLSAQLGPLALLFFAACGGAPAPAASAPEPTAPSSLAPGDDTYANVDEAERGLKRAEAELRAAVGTPKADAAGRPRDDRAPSADRAPSEPAPSAGSTTAAGREAQAQEGGPPCATACRAFTSMTRAAETICRLAGTSDERCARAQRSLEDARSSLRTCVCVTPGP